MAGKKGLEICSVGLKSFFALTARYNEVLKNGTVEDKERLKSDVKLLESNIRCWQMHMVQMFLMSLLL